jgi:SanA protein
MRRLIKYTFILTILSAGVAAASVWWIAGRSKGKIFRSAVNPPLPHPAQVALIPGASVLPNKTPSNTLLNRLRAGIELYNKEIVPKLLLSGDNTRRFYDEVHTMRDYCLRHGVKPEDIFLDHAGVRTYDTMVRARGTFAVKTAIIVSQELYLPRALLIAEAQGIKAEGFAAESSSFDNTWQASAREYLARLKSLWDIYAVKPVVSQDKPMPVTGDGRASWEKAGGEKDGYPSKQNPAP